MWMNKVKATDDQPAIFIAIARMFFKTYIKIALLTYAQLWMSSAFYIIFDPFFFQSAGMWSHKTLLVHQFWKMSQSGKITGSHCVYTL